LAEKSYINTWSVDKEASLSVLTILCSRKNAELRDARISAALLISGSILAVKYNKKYEIIEIMCSFVVLA